MSNFAVLGAPLIYSGRPGQVSIYALVDPRDMTVRYAGQTNDTVARLKQHTSGTGANRELNAWTKELVALHASPALVTLDRCSVESSGAVEADWIGGLRGSGALYNGDLRDARRRLRSAPRLVRPQIDLAHAMTVHTPPADGDQRLPWRYHLAQFSSQGDVDTWLRWLIANRDSRSLSLRKRPGSGRPRLVEGKLETYSIRTTSAERQTIEHAAAAMGITSSEWSRSVLASEAERQLRAKRADVA